MPAALLSCSGVPSLTVLLESAMHFSFFQPILHVGTMPTITTQSTPQIQRGPLRALSAACALVLACCAANAMSAEDPFANSQTALPPGKAILVDHYVVGANRDAPRERDP